MNSNTDLKRYKTLKKAFNDHLDNNELFEKSEDFSETLKVFFAIAWNSDEQNLDEITEEMLGRVLDVCVTLLLSEQREIARLVIRNLYFSGILGNPLTFVHRVVQLKDTQGSKKMDTALEIKEELDFLGLGDYSEKDIIRGILNIPKQETLDEFGDHSFSIIQTIREKPQWIDEVLEGVQYEEIKEPLRKWGNPSLTASVTDFYTKKIVSALEKRLKHQESKQSIEDFMEVFQEVKANLGLINFPAHFQSIIQPLSDFIQPRPVKIDEVPVPRYLLDDYVPKQVYISSVPKKPIDLFFVGGSGIGTSAILIRTQTASILLDFGMSVANNACPKWRYHRSLNFVDTVLVSHAHLDHVGSLPLLYALSYEGKWFSSKTTAEIASMLVWNNRTIIKSLEDKERVHNHEVLSKVVKKQHIGNFLSAYVPLRKKPLEIYPGIEVQSFETAHAPGSLGFKITIEDTSIVYTGDIKLEGSIMFDPPSVPDSDYTIFDGTYYGRETFTENPEKIIRETIDKYDRVIIPAFSMGRTQEILTILNEEDLMKDKDIYVPGLAGEISKTLGIEGNYQVGRFNPDRFVDNTIVIGGHGMLQAGTARDLLELTKNDPKTGVILCGYQAPGTLGYCLQQNYTVINRYKQHFITARMSGHSSSVVLDEWLDSREGKKIIVHTPTQEIDREDIVVPDYDTRIRIN